MCLESRYAFVLRSTSVEYIRQNVLAFGVEAAMGAYPYSQGFSPCNLLEAK